MAAVDQAIYWGAQIGDQLTGEQAPWDMNAVNQFEALAGKRRLARRLHLALRRLPTALHVLPLPHDADGKHPRPRRDPLLQLGLPVDLRSRAASTSPDFQLADVIAGRYDTYIREFADRGAAWGHPFFLRFNWEMNGNWFPWGEGVNGNQPGEYVAAWRHVHDIFTAVGATNATWVWCPNVDSGTSSLRPAPLYPGDAYVDWTCLDGYNWGTNPARRRLAELQRDLRLDLRAIAEDRPGKPMMIGEVGLHRATAASKADWIKDMLTSMPDRASRKIRGLIWFEMNDRGIDWPIESSPSVKNAFARASAIRSTSVTSSAKSKQARSPPRSADHGTASLPKVFSARGKRGPGRPPW